MRLRQIVASVGLALLAACGGGTPGYSTTSGNTVEVKQGDGQLVLSPQDIKHFEIVSAPEGHRLRIELTAGAAANLARTTRAHVGHRVALVIHGEIVMQPVVRDAIESGRLEISGKDDKDLARLQQLLRQ